LSEALNAESRSGTPEGGNRTHGLLVIAESGARRHPAVRRGIDVAKLYATTGSGPWISSRSESQPSMSA